MIYLYDGSFDGLLCVLHAHYYIEKAEAAYPEQGYQEQLGEGPVRVLETDPEVAEKAADAIRRKLGMTIFHRAFYAASTEDPERGTKVIRYLRICFAKGKRYDQYRTHPWIYPVHELAGLVGRHVEKYLGGLRFSQVGEVLYAPYEPEADITTILMEHFADRLHEERFIIHDLKRSVAGVYANGQWGLTALAGNYLEKRDALEKRWEEMWRGYFNSVTIEFRRDEKLQRNQMPKKFRKYMWEFHQNPASGEKEVDSGI